MMDPDRWRQIDALLLASLERPAEERVRFVEASAGDEKLKSEVLSLLSSDGRFLSMFEEPAFDGAKDLLATHIPELNPGQLVGHYRVISFLGAGGMAEVYLAEDTKLDRKVAIKLLAAENNLRGRQLNLLEREARAASALNHPNIITIYEIGRFEDKAFIVSEFIAGATLRQHLRNQRLSANQAIDIALQIARALSVAHDAGIVHRDIKPENVMLRADGYVKVLDFGLATILEDRESSLIKKLKVLETNPVPGLLIGTLKYMSPEQAQGLILDARTDIFSLGALIYEMIAGHSPFSGETNSDVIDSILKAEPPLAEYFADAPPDLQNIVSRCLCKEREQRYQSAKDLLNDLNNLRRRLEVQSEFGSAAVVGNSSANTDTASTRLTGFERLIARMGRRKVWWIALTSALLAGTILLTIMLTLKNKTKRAEAFQNATITKLISDGRSRDSAISPDGKYVAYVLDEPPQQTIRITQVATNESRQLVPPGAERLSALTFSRDGDRLFYVRYEKGSQLDTLYEIKISGGQPKRILSEVHSPISFSPDGQHFAFYRRHEGGNALLIAASDGTQEKELSSRDDANRFCDYPCGPTWSPDGSVIVCLIEGSGFNNITDFIAVNVKDGSERIFSSADRCFVTGISWLSDGSGLMMSAHKGLGSAPTHQIWHMSYPSGDARRVTNDLSDYVGVSITADSSVLAVTQRSSIETMLVISTKDATRTRAINFSRSLFYGLSWSPDGKIVYAQINKELVDIWRMNPDGTEQEQLTFNSGINVFPSVSPDGKYILFSSFRQASIAIWRMDIDGRNQKRLVEIAEASPTSCSPDSKWVLFRDAQHWWRVPVDGGEKVPIPGYDWPAISPDGKSVAWLYSNETESFGIAIAPFEGGDPIRKIHLEATPGRTSFEDETKVMWSRDGRALIFNTADLWLQPLHGGSPKQLTNFQGDTALWYDLSPDGQQLAVVRSTGSNDTVLINNNR